MDDIEQMVALASRAKTKIKAHNNGWSLVSKEEIIALAFIADIMLEDYIPTDPPVALKPQPKIISEV